MIYAGIGSREVPPDVARLIRSIGSYLARKGMLLRSGAATGSDALFERGSDEGGGKKEIFLPWKGFNKHISHLHNIPIVAFEIAEKYYSPYAQKCSLPPWRGTKRPTKMFMARDVMQVLGEDCETPVDFVIAWTQDGCTTQKDRTTETGGTGQAIATASDLNIPVYNLKNPEDIFFIARTYCALT